MVDQKLIQLGKKVKDFTLKNQHGREFSLSSQGGKKVLLSFHPLAWTSVCAEQMKSLERTVKQFSRFNTVAVGLSVDSVPCKAAWAKSLRIKQTELLSDFWPHGGIAKRFGLLRPEGFSERANVIVDESGKVMFIKVYPIKKLPDLGEILQVLKNRT